MTNAPKAEVLRLVDSVTHQPDSVVSRQIIKSDAGNVTLFGFDAGQELSEHTTPFDALVHVLDGEVEIRIRGEVSNLKAGDAIVMPAGVPHAVRALRPFKMLLTMIRA